MSDITRILAGILLLSLMTVETGGVYLVRLVQGAAPATPFNSVSLAQDMPTLRYRSCCR
ncbi:hypothetical protein [Mycobacterium sp.]|uniref:hypothetical protein n=1 Tax=Mycobacterium sp. TaxID=1785 RepID=UPI0025F6EB57|nr:hypothetical protein [Mycobacterium sp.]